MNDLTAQGLPDTKAGLVQRVSGITTTVTAGNTIYDVFVEDQPSWGVGMYTVMTGAVHPVTIATGFPQNVLYGGGSPGTTFNTIRSFTTGTDYVQGTIAPASAYPVVLLDPGINPAINAVTNPVGTTGFSTTYTVPGPDFLTIHQVVNVNGTIYDDSSVEVTTTVTNDGTAPVMLGIRYQWDFQIGMDDGPPFAERNPDAPDLIYESDFVMPGFEFYRIQDNDINVPTPLFSVFGTVNGPGGISPMPTQPDLMKHAAWPLAFNTAFDYMTTATLDICTVAAPNRGFAGGDNCVMYYFGATPNSAIELFPGESVTVSQSLFAAVPDDPPPFTKIPVYLDIKPTSCPNPFNVKSKGVLPVAILGTADFDVADIDVSTLLLEGVAPIRYGMADVATPFTGELCDCHELAGDGFMDLTLKFKRQELVEALGSTHDRDLLQLTLSGYLLDGREIEGMDCIIVLNPDSRIPNNEHLTTQN